MKKTILTLSLAMIGFASSAFALSDEELVRACEDAGKAKLAAQAQQDDCKVYLEQIQVTGVDNRADSITKSVYFLAPANCGGQDRMSVTVEYTNGICR